MPLYADQNSILLGSTWNNVVVDVKSDINLVWNFQFPILVKADLQKKKPLPRTRILSGVQISEKYYQNSEAVAMRIFTLNCVLRFLIFHGCSCCGTLITEIWTYSCLPIPPAEPSEPPKQPLKSTPEKQKEGPRNFPLLQGTWPMSMATCKDFTPRHATRTLHINHINIDTYMPY